MPMMPSSNAKAAKATKREVVDAGAETASETTAPMVLTSLTGTSWFRAATLSRSIGAICEASEAVRIAMVISEGTRRSSRVAEGVVVTESHALDVIWRVVRWVASPNTRKDNTALQH